MNQLFKQEDLIGKTISQIHLSSGDLWMKFTDNTFSVFRIEDKSEAFGYTDNVITVSDWIYTNTDKELVVLGLVSERNHKEALAEEEAEYEERRKKREEEDMKRIEQQELEQYKKLAEKFGNSNCSHCGSPPGVMCKLHPAPCKNRQ
jgi:hypothetical protein